MIFKTVNIARGSHAQKQKKLFHFSVAETWGFIH